MSIAIVIPARYASSRYPGKPLTQLEGATGEKKSLIRRSWDAAMSVRGVKSVLVATDDDRIRKEAEGFGAQVAMTSSDCKNGTERCADTLRYLGDEIEVVVNLQGDAPLTPPWFVEDLIEALRKSEEADMATPVLRADRATLDNLMEDRSAGRVGATTAVFDANNRALYFSKEVIPFGANKSDASDQTDVFHHVGVYAYRRSALTAYQNWPVGPLEAHEGLEQLRFLEQGKWVTCVEVDARGAQFWEINNPEDVPRLEAMMVDMGLP